MDTAVSERITIDRALWADVLNALDSRDPADSRAAFHRLLAAGPLSWDGDIEKAPGREHSQPRITPDAAS